MSLNGGTVEIKKIYIKSRPHHKKSLSNFKEWIKILYSKRCLV